MADSGWTLLLSCEHGGNRVPKPWRPLFAGHEALLESHRGYDIGIAPFARWLAKELQVSLQLAETSRLLVELNRSPGHPALFSAFSRSLDRKERQRLQELYYAPYRDNLQRQIAAILQSGGRVCHVSLHSFTPELHGSVRNADIGLLYDPQRPQEKAFCLAWQAAIIRQAERWRVRRNYPYRGAADSFVTHLRRHFPETCYLGIELELNQRWPLQGGEGWASMQRLIRDTLQTVLTRSGRVDGAPE
jgi:predicted N-formylglutamate amidohydrolase